MRLSIILSLYSLKIKVFFGSLRASKANIALLLIYIFGFLPSIVNISSILANSLRRCSFDVLLYVDVLAAAASAIITFSLLLSLRGVTAFEYEQNIIFASPLHPREVLVAGFLASLTYLLIFTSPLFILYALIIISLSLPPPQATIIFLVSLIFAISTILLKMFLSLVKALYGKAWVSALILVAALILMAPALGIFGILPLRYSTLPYPSTFFARILIDAFLNKSPHAFDCVGLTLFLIVSSILFAAISGRNFFSFTTQIPLVSPFDVSLRSQTFKMESNIRLFSRINIPISLNLKTESLLAFLVKKEIARIIREGSLFTIILIYSVFSIVFAAVGHSVTSELAPLPFILSIYSVIIPVMLIGNWRILESRNLWLPLSSGADLRAIVKATLYAFIIVSISVPMAIILPISLFYGFDSTLMIAILVPTSLIGCSVNLYVAIKFLGGKRRGAPSFLVGWLSMILLMLLLAPVYALVALSLTSLIKIPNIVVLLTALLYSMIMMRIFLGLVENDIRFIEV